VFTAGAAQALAKGERIAIGDRVVVSGAGPFLLPVASALRSVGARVVSVHEAARTPALARGWLRHPHRLASFARKFGELIEYGWGHVVHGIPYRLGEGVVAAHGTGRVETVTVARLDADWAPIPGTERRIKADAVCVGHGFIPRVELAVASGCTLEDGFVVVDHECRTTVGAVFAAGEVTGIGGADAALIEGEIAGAAAAGGVIDTALQRRQRGARDFTRRLVDAHGIRPGWVEWLQDETTVCRCEEVTFGALCRGAAETDQRSLRSIKLTTRVGLGVCQGRMCGRTVEQLLGIDPSSGLVDKRPIVTPVRLAELSAQPHPTLGGSP
jgi:NADPH-dependent 2,4-dienoyl-CoA reductase/sulfur reductase-like enzyme